ncbi:MAG: hypothetical protein KKA32_00370 [Actinobacteria bacterium]|nr:hypothetical protein [Actinomycetota bacterium]
MFRIIYLFILTEPPSWVAYVHTAVMFALMGLAYIQAGRKRIGFMAVFLTMTGIFMFDILGYLPFLAWMRIREGRRAAAARAASTE